MFRRRAGHGDPRCRPVGLSPGNRLPDPRPPFLDPGEALGLSLGHIVEALIIDDRGNGGGFVSPLIAERLAKRARIRPARLTILSTHTHSAPWLKDYLPNLFVTPLTDTEEQHIARYTRELADALETVALRALGDRRPSKLNHAKGQAAFAANRRTKGGPVDHDLPALFVTDPKGNLRGICATYACHCTTLTGEFNQICGDWASYAREFLERDHPGTGASGRPD